MAEQVRRGIAWVYRNADKFDGDRDRLYIGGHSSGGHLCGVALVTDWQNDFRLPEDMVKGGLCMSGMYDMKAVRLSKRSTYVKFTDEMEQAMSSQRHLDLLRAPIIVTYGTHETPEFQRQNRDFAAAVKAAGKPVELVEAPHFNHFEILESLGNPYGPNGHAALALMKLSPVRSEARRLPAPPWKCQPRFWVFPRIGRDVHWGDAFALPTCGGRCNSYTTRSNRRTSYHSTAEPLHPTGAISSQFFYIHYDRLAHKMSAAPHWLARRNRNGGRRRRCRDDTGETMRTDEVLSEAARVLHIAVQLSDMASR